MHSPSSLSPLALALLGQRPVKDDADQEPDDEELDFVKVALAQQQREEEVARRKAVVAAKEDAVWKDLEKNAVGVGVPTSDDVDLAVAKQAAGLARGALAQQESNQREDEVAASLQSATGDKVRRSLMEALNPSRVQPSLPDGLPNVMKQAITRHRLPHATTVFNDLVEADLDGGVERPTSVYVQQRKQNPNFSSLEDTGTHRIPLDAQSNRSPSMPVPFERVLTMSRPIVGENELEQYMPAYRDAFESQKQFHLKKYKGSSPEDAAAYLADRVENAPHEAVDELNDWTKKDALAKRMQGRRFDLEEKEADKADEYKRKSRRFTHSGAERNFRERLLGPKKPGDKTRQDELADSAMRDYEDAQKYADAKLGGIRQAERGTTRGDAADKAWRRRQGSVQGSERDDAVEFEKRKQNTSDAREAMASGGTLTDAMLGEGGYGMMSRKNNQPRNWSSTQRENINTSRNKFAGERLLARRGFNDALEGKDAPDETSPAYDKAYEEGRRRRLMAVGPTSRQSYDVAMEQARNAGMRGMTGGQNGLGVARARETADIGKAAVPLLALAKQARDQAVLAKTPEDKARLVRDAEAFENQVKLMNDEQAGSPAQPPAPPANKAKPLSARLIGDVNKKPVALTTPKSQSATTTTTAKPSPAEIAGWKMVLDQLNKRRRNNGPYAPYGAAGDRELDADLKSKLKI